MVKQKCEEMIESHLRCSRPSESLLLLLFFSYVHAKNMSVVRCSMCVNDLLHFRAVDVDTLPDSFLRRHEKLSGIG